MNKLEECATALKAKMPLGYGMTPDEAREYARAVIRCLMEPTAEMLAAALPIVDHPSNADMRLGADAFTILSGENMTRAEQGIMAGAELARDLRAMLQYVLDGKE